MKANSKKQIFDRKHLQLMNPLHNGFISEYSGLYRFNNHFITAKCELMHTSIIKNISLTFDYQTFCKVKDLLIQLN